jgi:hypothetical protein
MVLAARRAVKEARRRRGFMPFGVARTTRQALGALPTPGHGPGTPGRPRTDGDAVRSGTLPVPPGDLVTCCARAGPGPCARPLSDVPPIAPRPGQWCRPRTTGHPPPSPPGWRVAHTGAPASSHAADRMTRPARRGAGGLGGRKSRQAPRGMVYAFSAYIRSLPWSRGGTHDQRLRQGSGAWRMGSRRRANARRRCPARSRQDVVRSQKPYQRMIE